MSSVFVFDTETNGCTFLPSVYSDRHKIIQIAVTHLASNASFQTLVQIDDDIAIPTESSDIHGIRSEYLDQKPFFKIAFKKMLLFIDDCLENKLDTTPTVVLVAHNNHGFDEIVLKKECLANYVTIPKNFVFFDTLPLFKKLFPQRADLPYNDRYNLNSIHLAVTGSTIFNAHNAFADVTALVTIFNGLEEKINFFNPEFHTSQKMFTMTDEISVLKGIGPYSAKKISQALGDSFRTSSVEKLVLFLHGRSLPQIETFLRTFCTHEKHVLSLLLLFFDLVSAKSLTIEEKIDIVENFPHVHNNMPFHNVFSVQSVANIQKNMKCYSVLDLVVLDKYTYENASEKLQKIGVPLFEVMKFTHTANKYI